MKFHSLISLFITAFFRKIQAAKLALKNPVKMALKNPVKKKKK